APRGDRRGRLAAPPFRGVPRADSGRRRRRPMATPDPVRDSHRGFQASIIRFAVRFRGTVVALAFLLLGYGAISLLQAKYDVFPEVAPPQVRIQAEAPALTAEQVEVLVTQPIENAVNGVPGVESLRSVSIQGLSVITIIFQ